MKQILIIDDEPQMRSMLKKMFEREGFDVTTASDGEKGIKTFKKNPADLIITDLIMPEKEGIELIMEFKKDYPDVPILAMSGGGRNSPDTYLNISKRLGAYAVFEKPIEKKELLAVIKKALKL
jgi:DNA-binding NtrC family response regulator